MNKVYVLITAARNEEGYIEKSIESVISQTILPEKWVIVSDSSTDRTDEIVKQYIINYGFIHLVCRKHKDNRNFASQVFAQHEGYKQIRDINFEFIGMLDADISFKSDYYERILDKFSHNKKLGIAGGWIHELQGGKCRERFGNNLSFVPGAIQMFHRKCFEDIGGHIPLKKGGQDSIADIMARGCGWEVKSFQDIKAIHHRKKLKIKDITRSRFIQGQRDYILGYHPLFEILKCISRIREGPYFLGCLLRFIGYCWAFFRKREKINSKRSSTILETRTVKKDY